LHYSDYSSKYFTPGMYGLFMLVAGAASTPDRNKVHNIDLNSQTAYEIHLKQLVNEEQNLCIKILDIVPFFDNHSKTKVKHVMMYLHIQSYLI